jgi:hypothetical protein
LRIGRRRGWIRCDFVFFSLSTFISFANYHCWYVGQKTAEQDALKKAKENQNAAGKVSGMSGWDLFDYRPEWFEAEEEDEEEDDSNTAARNARSGGDGESGEDGSENGGWDLDKMRRETEEERERMEREEEERVEGLRIGFDAAALDG